MKRLVAYARVSTRLQEGNTSIPDQHQRIVAFCAAMEHELVGAFDDVESGSKADRPGLMSALKIVLEDNDADGIICCYMDRLGRDVRNFLDLVAQFNAAGKSLIFLDNMLDTGTVTGKCVSTILMSVAQMMREQTAEKSRNGRAYLRSQGKYSGGQPPYGWTAIRDSAGKTNHEMVPAPEEQRVLKMIVEWDAKNVCPTDIAEKLNKLAISTRHKGKWHCKQIQRILQRVG